MCDIRIIIVIILFLSLQLDAKLIINNTHTKEDAQLVCANVIFRHGDRNIIEPYPKDPYKKKIYWPRGYGKLTSTGIEQAFELGKYLGRRYQSILGDGKYSNNMVYVRSTRMQRTMMSASACLAGLLPPQGDEVWNINLMWQPVPVRMKSASDWDNLLLDQSECPRFDRLMYQNIAMYSKYKSSFKFLAKNSGSVVRDVYDVYSLLDTLRVEQWKNKTLPTWTQEVLKQGSEFEWLASQCMLMSTFNPEFARLSIGFLIREMLENFTHKIESKLQPAIFLYSAHDSTIVDVLNSLGLFEFHWPPFASSIHFELYKSKEDYYVQLFYRNTSQEHPLPLKIPECGTKCPLEEFYRIYSDIIPTGEFDEECQLSLYLRILEGGDIFISTQLFVALIGSLVIIVFIILWTIFGRKREHDQNNTKLIWIGRFQKECEM